ncbi:hypothetical protein C5B42_03825 [Candidatus Cerribacteria bacterium 'Amazon FNV 2010 28 9']|uniref:Uncharacterized protein n=1 Tax=Candidatus Cerribacteria bacterium 'Amazon FNV 2010 28 9' TaxID=2081795 RepID=A0A317JPT6_9BACT|nr:MAG: hypothetical protein C5B42_03825 [Candidatus Cerribacteria bacterium 'Amazon FNV 2010 28 9']
MEKQKHDSESFIGDDGELLVPTMSELSKHQLREILNTKMDEYAKMYPTLLAQHINDRNKQIILEYALVDGIAWLTFQILMSSHHELFLPYLACGLLFLAAQVRGRGIPKAPKQTQKMNYDLESATAGPHRREIHILLKATGKLQKSPYDQHDETLWQTLAIDFALVDRYRKKSTQDARMAKTRAKKERETEAANAYTATLARLTHDAQQPTSQSLIELQDEKKHKRE